MEELNVRAGAFFRMRCGGAVRIDAIFEEIALHEEQGITWRVKDGYYCFPESPSIFDLVAEISEQEYNRIVSGKSYQMQPEVISQIRGFLTGEPSGNSEQVEALKAEIEELKRDNNNMRVNRDAWMNDYNKLKAENEKLKLALQMKNKPDNEQREQHRFEAAKLIYPALLNHPWILKFRSESTGCPKPELVAQETVSHIDALMKALEGKP